MNKKVIAMAVTAALAAPMMAQASDISFKADARYRWGNIDQTVGGTSTNISNTYDSRVRVIANAKNDDGISAHARIVADMGSTKGVDADYAYVSMPLMGGMATLDAGDQMASWGLGFKIKDVKKDGRVKVTVPVAGWKIGAAYDPADIAGNAFITGKAGGWNVGLLSAGKMTDVFAKGKAGPVGLAFEYNSNDTGAAKPVGMLLMGKYPMGNMNINFGYASAADTFTAHKKWTPISTIGTDQLTGIMDFGTGGDQSAILVGVDLDAGPGHLAAMFGQVSPSVGDASTALDVKYQMGVFGVTYGTISGTGYSYNAFGANINAKF